MLEHSASKSRTLCVKCVCLSPKQADVHLNGFTAQWLLDYSTFFEKVQFNLRGVGTLHMEYYLNLLYCMKSEIFLAVIWMISCLGWMNRLHSNSKSSNLYIHPFSCLEKRWECANNSQHWGSTKGLFWAALASETPVGGQLIAVMKGS